jgi:hypothetical protein
MNYMLLKYNNAVHSQEREPSPVPVTDVAMEEK